MNFQHARASASSTVENKVTKVFIVIYTTYGHTYQMATKVKEGSDGSRQPSEDELIRAYDQGKSFAAIAKKLSV
eukprot:jgi/Pico_ML_1/51929/g2720.t1